MKINKIYYLLLSLLVPFLGYSQQVPLYSQYIWNAYLINPAIGGAENFLDLKAGYRTQWVGLEGSPNTFFLTANTQLGKKVLNREDKDVIIREGKAASNKSKVAELLGYRKPEYPNIPKSYTIKPHHGIGLQVMGDRIGPFSTMAVYGNYAYHMPITNKIYASAGVFLGVKQYRLDASKVVLDNQSDPLAGIDGNLNGMSPDGMAGLMLYSERFYVGLSASQIFNANFRLRKKAGQYVGAEARLEPHFFATAGYRISVSREFAFVPSTLVRMYPGTDVSVDLTGKINYLDLLWGGVSYRAGEAVVFLAGISYGHMLDFGYSYDMSLSKNKKFPKIASHEIMVGYRMVNNNTKGKPSFVW
jgi:type IX secretion system PorP/SprF family membrane protein